MNVDLTKRLLDEYCSQCKKGGAVMSSVSTTSNPQIKLIAVLYRIYALEKAAQLENKEFIDKCFEGCPYNKYTKG